MQTPTAQTLADLMSSLQRFFKIGACYPAGHTVADHAAASFLHALQEVAGEHATSVHFVVSESSLALQGIELDLSLYAVQYFHDLLHSLSISTLEMHRDITAEELRLLLSRLLFIQTKVQGSRHFQDIEITGLPSTVKVLQQKFVARESSSGGVGSDDSSQPTIDDLLSSLIGKGLKEDNVAMCRQLLESIQDALCAGQFAESNLPSVSWVEVEKLLLSIAESSNSHGQNDKTLRTEKDQQIDSLVNILKSIEGETKTTKSRDAINLLVKLANGSKPPPRHDKQKTTAPAARDEQSGFTINELYQMLAPLQNLDLPADLGENIRGEELSILMQMIGQWDHLHTKKRMQETLLDCLRAPLADKEWQVVIQGMQQLLKTLDRERVETSVLMIIDILRRSSPKTPLLFLHDVCQGLSREELMAFWPFLINEAFIVGPQDEPELFREICSIASQLSRQDMLGNIARLERLDALVEKRIASAVFSPPAAVLNPIFVLLLNSSHENYIKEQLVLGIRRNPICWLDKAVSPLLDCTLPSHKQFMIELLKKENNARPSKNLKNSGLTIIVEKLPEVPAGQRNEEWVATTIAALAKAQVPGGRDLLDNIINSKHYLFIPDWPGACRLAARKVLDSIYWLMEIQ